MAKNEVTRLIAQVTRRRVGDRVALVQIAERDVYDEGILACTAGERLRRPHGIGGIGGTGRLR